MPQASHSVSIWPGSSSPPLNVPLKPLHPLRILSSTGPALVLSTWQPPLSQLSETSVSEPPPTMAKAPEGDTRLGGLWARGVVAWGLPHGDGRGGQGSRTRGWPDPQEVWLWSEAGTARGWVRGCLGALWPAGVLRASALAADPPSPWGGGGLPLCRTAAGSTGLWERLVRWCRVGDSTPTPGPHQTTRPYLNRRLPSGEVLLTSPLSPARRGHPQGSSRSEVPSSLGLPIPTGWPVREWVVVWPFCPS